MKTYETYGIICRREIIRTAFRKTASPDLFVFVCAKTNVRLFVSVHAEYRDVRAAVGGITCQLYLITFNGDIELKYV